MTFPRRQRRHACLSLPVVHRELSSIVAPADRSKASRLLASASKPVSFQ